MCALANSNCGHFNASPYGVTHSLTQLLERSQWDAVHHTFGNHVRIDAQRGVAEATEHGPRRVAFA